MKTIKRRKGLHYLGVHKRVSKKKGTPYNGGGAIAAGSFGCVFRPSLRCKTDDSRKISSDELVSKLGKKSVIEEEYQVMTKLKKILVTIPNSKEYFGLDVSKPCEPDSLNKEDLFYFDKKCKFKDIDEKTVNEPEVLSSLSFIDLPYGGISLLKWIWEGNLKNIDSFVSFLHKSSLLIRHGIVPMNKKGVLHNDIHARNILAEIRNNSNNNMNTISSLSLIDWGLATTHTATSMKKITVQRDYPITRIFFMVKIKKPFFSFVQSNMTHNKITEYSYSKSSAQKKSVVYSLLLRMSFELISLSMQEEEKNMAYSCRDCDRLYKNVLEDNEIYKNTYMPFLEKYISANLDNGSKIYDIGITFTSFVNTIYLADMMHKYIEVNNSVLSIKFRDYFTDVYRYNADVYAMCNCILLGTSKRMELDDDYTIKEKHAQLAEELLNEVFLKSTIKINYDKVCDFLDKMTK
jgi:hypothetical protein